MSGLVGGLLLLVWFLGFGDSDISFDGVFVLFDSQPYVYRDFIDNFPYFLIFFSCFPTAQLAKV